MIAAAAVVAALLAPAWAAPPARVSNLLKRTEAAHPGALWHVVHDLCVTDMQTIGSPAPCLKVDLAAGYAVLKDIADSTQLLVVPTARVTGVESPVLLQPGSPNYWQAAWAARGLFARQAGRPVGRDDLVLVVNSAWARTQNQLHIHIDCIRPDVREALRSHAAQLHGRWTVFPARLAGHRYRARWVAGEDLRDVDPFKLLASGDHRARDRMGRANLAAAGAFQGRAPGFVLLTRVDRRPRPKAVGAEELMDHSCRVLDRA